MMFPGRHTAACPRAICVHQVLLVLLAATAAAIASASEDPAITTATSAGAAAPSFVALATYAWTGQATDGIQPSEATAAAASSGSEAEAKYHRALDAIALMFPAEARKINKHRAQLIKLALKGGKPSPALAKVKATRNSTLVQSQSSIEPAALSPCAEQAIMSGIDLIGVVMSVIAVGTQRVWTKVSKGLVKYFFSEVGARFADTFVTLFRAVADAATKGAKAKAVWDLVWTMFSTFGSVILTVCQDCMAWWEWLLFGVSLVLGFGAMIATGGAFVIVNIVSALAAGAQFGAGVAKLIILCAGL